MPRKPGTKNRNFPPLSLEETLEIPKVIEDLASGEPVSKLHLADFVNSTPSSSSFRNLLLASRMYGFTGEGVNQDTFSLTSLGHEATSSDPEKRQTALRSAVLSIAPYREFLTKFNTKKIPAAPFFKEWLNKSADVPLEWTDECMDRLLEDARVVGFLRDIKGSQYVELKTNGSVAHKRSSEDETEYEEAAPALDEHEAEEASPAPLVDSGTQSAQTPPVPGKPKVVFIAHGKNHGPVEQLKALLTDLGVPFKVVKDEAHAGRPISAKVAQAMRDDCSSAICIFSADEKFYRTGEDNTYIEVWRPSENAIYELGAASVLYGSKIILFKEDRVTLPSDFSDIGHITFSSDGIVSHMAELLKELRAHGIIQVVVAS